MAVGASSHLQTPPGPTSPLPPLEAGDRLDQKTFHARYEAMPPGVKAELIGGIVYMPSPLRLAHGTMDPIVAHWLSEYRLATPGVIVAQNATVILGADSEPQPDSCLLIDPSRGGQTREKDGYLEGPPELIVEIASSTESYDLSAKKSDYEKAGVREYIVVALRQEQLFWFVLADKSFRPLAPHGNGLFRSPTFPGLWLDPAALLRRDAPRVLEVLRQGLADAEHSAFAHRLL